MFKSSTVMICEQRLAKLLILTGVVHHSLIEIGIANNAYDSHFTLWSTSPSHFLSIQIQSLLDVFIWSTIYN